MILRNDERNENRPKFGIIISIVSTFKMYNL